MDATGTALVAVGEEYVDALASRDFERVARCLAPDVHLRSLKPPGPDEHRGAEIVVAALRGWFGSASEFEALKASAEPIGDRVHLAYRFRLDGHPQRPGSGPQVVEQHVFCTVESGRITAADMLCSGFRPA